MDKPIIVEEGVDLSKYTTLHVGGKAQYFAEVKSVADLKEVTGWAKSQNLQVKVLGGGSNILVSGEGVDGVVIKVSLLGIKEEEVGNDVSITCQAGENFDDCVRYAVDRNWWGLENLSHIPGTVGATPVQNVGAYGVEVGDLIAEVSVYDFDNDKEKILTNHECEFNYRTSLFKKINSQHLIITSVTFKLSKVSNPKLSYKDLLPLNEVDNITIGDIRNSVIKIRQEKFPDWNIVGTAGSFFKNPIVRKEEAEAVLLEYPLIPTYSESNDRIKLSLGYILDKVCGLKGYAKNRVSLYDKQAMVLVAEKGASEKEINEFADEVIEKVFEKIKIKIEREVVCW